MKTKKLTEIFNKEEIISMLLSKLGKVDEQLYSLHKRILELEEKNE